MRVFVTGATGFIGARVVDDLIKNGHHVLGLSRSDEGEKALKQAGAEVHRGHLEDLASLRSGAEKAEGVIHTAFIHDFSKFQENCAIDTRAIEAIGDVLAGSARRLIITSGTGMGNAKPGELASEDNFDPHHPNPRVSSELAAASVQKRGVAVSSMRLPQVHDAYKSGLVPFLIAHAKEKGVSAYVGEGRNRWPSAHVLDVATLYRLAIEKGVTGARYNAVAEEGVEAKAIAEAIARGLNVPLVSKTPEEAGAHFGWLAMFVGLDMPASSALTQKRLGWKPVQKTTLLEDLAKPTAYGQTSKAA